MNHDPQRALDALAGCQAPTLFGVRHHSPACAAAVEVFLDDLRPQILLIELPVEFDPWLSWVGHEGAAAPLAIAGGRSGREDLFFYPFADFSPELAALRWACRNSVPVHGIDRPLLSRDQDQGEAGPRWRAPAADGLPLVRELCRAASARDSEDLWDRLVEARAPGGSAEQVRRAALLAGWALRVDAAAGHGIDRDDLRRETFMRRFITERAAGARACAVIGAFHAPALLPEPLMYEEQPAATMGSTGDAADLRTSLVPYSFDLLDSRSGYPAGIRDPRWQQGMLRAAVGPGSPARVDELLTGTVVDICRRLRRRGHVAGIPHEQEAVRIARDLAAIRGLPCPGRQELLEGLSTALTEGELLGRGRVLAEVMDEVMVGRRRGRLARGTPRSGLAPHVAELLTALRMPHPGGDGAAGYDEPAQLRLDPLRSELDRRRHVAARRLAACGIPYADLQESARDDTLTSVWTVQWTPQVEAMIEIAGARGVTLSQAAAGALRAEERRLEADEALVPARRLALLEAAAECGLPSLVEHHVDQLAGPFLEQAGLAELVGATSLTRRLEGGHLAGCPPPGPAGQGPHARALPGAVSPLGLDLSPVRSELLACCVKACEGLFGSEEVTDARALLDMTRIYDRDPGDLGDGRLLWTVMRLSREGTPLMQGAAGAALVMLGGRPADEFGVDIGSWIDAACGDAGGKQALAGRLKGALIVASPLFEGQPLLLSDPMRRIERIDDHQFLARLPALREGFDALSPAARGRLLEVVIERLDERGDAVRAGDALLVEDDPQLLAWFAEADAAGRAALGDQLPGAAAGGGAPPAAASAPPASRRRPADAAAAGEQPPPPGSAGHTIPPLDRWRLVLGRQRRELPPRAGRMARALDELYGAGRGEGSRGAIGDGGGKEDGFPTARTWSAELEELFGGNVREEVLGLAVGRGRIDALLELDPDAVTPSVELLEQVLSLRGGLPEAHLPRLRRLVRRIVEQLVEELAVRVRPSLTGLATPRPTRRPVGPLDLRRTVSANLQTTRFDEEGKPWITAERLFFRTRSQRSIDWRVVLLVDVSGSMEPSVIFSAMMAAILTGLPAVSVNFVTFNTEVIDLTEHAADPLALLLEISVGGGTHIAKAVRYAQSLINVPARTMLLLITDFEEGWAAGSLVAEVQRVVQAGVTALGLAALDDQGKPRFNHGVAQQVADVGMPVAALTPLELSRWIGEQIR